MMLNLTELNKTIEKRQMEKEQEAKEVTFKQFLLIKDQIEKGIASVAADGMRSGRVVILTDFKLVSSTNMEKEIMRHYSPIDIRINENLTRDDPTNKLKSYFALDIFIPHVEENSNFGLDIMK